MKTYAILFLSLFYSLFRFYTDKTEYNNINDSLITKTFTELEELFLNNETVIKNLYANTYYRKALKERNVVAMLEGKNLIAIANNDETIFLSFCDSLIENEKQKKSDQLLNHLILRKARFLFHKNKQSKALEVLSKTNFQKNDSLNCLKSILLGAIKSSVNKHKDALKYEKKAYQYALNNNLIEKQMFRTITNNISVSYLKLNKIDSASIFSNIAIKLHKKLNDKILLSYSYYHKACIEFHIKNYPKSITYFKKSISGVKKDKNYNILISIYSKLAEAQNLIEQKKLALKNHIKSDSIYNVTKINNYALAETFSFLKSYYKKQNNKEKQLHYVNKILALKEFELTEKNKIQQTFTNEFDIPKLLEERKRIVEEIERKSRRNQFLFISLLSISIGFIFYQIRKNRIQRKRFEALLNKQKKDNESSINAQVQDSKPKLELSESMVKHILEQLEYFEKNNEFIDINLNLQSLATKFDTNASYLSKVVNHYKQTSFSNYINQLRIEYCVEQLKHNELWRKYTIKAIANEVGFNKAESFSKAFYKYTELRPSYFIKELKKKAPSSF